MSTNSTMTILTLSDNKKKCHAVIEDNSPPNNAMKVEKKQTPTDVQ